MNFFNVYLAYEGFMEYQVFLLVTLFLISEHKTGIFRRMSLKVM